MKTIVIVEKNEPVTTSVIISEGIGMSHHSVIKLIRNHLEELNQLGNCRFEIQKSAGAGRPVELMILNEPQTTFLITLMRNTKVVSDFKLKLVKEFYRMKKALADVMVRQQNEEWKQIRSTGKLARKTETDTIKRFVEYAVSQGSKNAERYYSNISTMENKSLFFLDQKYSNVRELLTGHQIGIIMSADGIVEAALKDGMDRQMPYKEIYQMAKERIEIFASLMPKTPVPMISNNLLT